MGLLFVLPLLGAEVEVLRIAVARGAGAVLQHYAGVAAREIQLRFQVKTPVAAACAAGGLCLQVAPGAKAWRIAPEGGRVIVEGATELDAVHALGVALRHLEASDGKLRFRGAATSIEPAVALRGIYAPAHMNNPYAKLSIDELGRLFEDWALWGASATWNWADPMTYMPRVDPFSREPGAEESLVYTRKVLASLGAAQGAGLEVGLTLGTNVVWYDQFRHHPELRAQLGARLMTGQLLCPSRPEGRKIILNNTRNLLAEAKRMGLRIGSLDFYTRDPSGCACERCNPWNRTSITVSRAIVEAAREIYPKIVGDLVTWYWKPEESRDAVAWFGSQGAQNWLRFWFHHFPTWRRDISFPELRLPALARLGGMYNLSAADNDVYGTEGAITRFAYLSKLLPPFPEKGLQGFHGYTEGNYDDLNKVVALQLLSTPRRPVRDIVEEYCRWHFGARGATATELADLIIRLDDLHANAAQLGTIVERLLAIEKSLPAWGRDWRFAQIRLRAQIAQINMEILDGIPPHGAEAGAPAPVDYKSVVGKRIRELMRRGLELHRLNQVQDAAWDAYKHLLDKDALVRKRSVLLHELMHVYKVDADHAIGLTNIYLGDWPVWFAEQHTRYNRLVGLATVAEQHKLIAELWP
jgi:hypothetical protein